MFDISKTTFVFIKYTQLKTFQINCGAWSLSSLQIFAMGKQTVYCKCINNHHHYFQHQLHPPINKVTRQVDFLHLILLGITYQSKPFSCRALHLKRKFSQCILSNAMKQGQ